ncbi:MAG TPA: hydratase [Hyphomicrobium sp.]|nr:hydratase [Hyphomicrobium sp.]
MHAHDDGELTQEQIEAIAVRVLATYDERTQISSIARQIPGFDLGAAYQVCAKVRKLREARGERTIGRKLGFTNRNIWEEYKVYAPIWNYVYDTTVRQISPEGATFDMGLVVEPRLEPEITLALKHAPEPGMDERALMDCIAWVAHGYEVVQSLFPGWIFEPADTVAAFGLHGALLLGPRHEITQGNRDIWFGRLTAFEVALFRNEQLVDRGHARNVLGGPLSALRNAVDVIAADPFNPPIAAGEFVTTGTVTRAFPMLEGDTWRSQFSGAPFEGLLLILGRNAGSAAPHLI